MHDLNGFIACHSLPPLENTKRIDRPFFVPKLCNHCREPNCVHVCPLGATYVSREGIVLVDDKHCVGWRLLPAGLSLQRPLEVWFVYRPEIIARARTSSGIMQFIYSALALWSMDDSPEALKLDHKIISVMAAVGIPSACTLHGYVGFLFGSLKANPWWSTPLMPVIFLMSAIVSGISILIVSYYVIMIIRKEPVDNLCLQSMYKYLWGFFIIDVTLEFLGELSMAYSKSDSWRVVSWMLEERLHFSYTILQMGICSLIPLVVLGFVALKPMSDVLRNRLGLMCSVLLLVQVLAMRWNVVVGGQLFSKSMRGLTSYAPTLLGREGILVAVILFCMPFVAMYVFNLILPLFNNNAEEKSQG
jgi:Ni/Fe-hydrogenase subunit HybB-like protein